jgi:hypothetical protein
MHRQPNSSARRRKPRRTTPKADEAVGPQTVIPFLSPLPAVTSATTLPRVFSQSLNQHGATDSTTYAREAWTEQTPIPDDVSLTAPPKAYAFGADAASVPPAADEFDFPSADDHVEVDFPRRRRRRWRIRVCTCRQRRRRRRHKCTTQRQRRKPCTGIQVRPTQETKQDQACIGVVGECRQTKQPSFGFGVVDDETTQVGFQPVPPDVHQSRCPVDIR